MDRLLDLGEAVSEEGIEQRLAALGQLTEQGPARGAHRGVAGGQPLADLGSRVRALRGQHGDIGAAHVRALRLAHPAVEVGRRQPRGIDDLHREVAGVEVAGVPEGVRELVVDADPLAEQLEGREADAEHRPGGAVTGVGLARLLGAGVLELTHRLREGHPRRGWLRGGLLCGGLRRGGLRGWLRRGELRGWLLRGRLHCSEFLRGELLRGWLRLLGGAGGWHGEREPSRRRRGLAALRGAPGCT